MEDLIATGTKGNILEDLKIYWQQLIDTCRYDITTGDGKEIPESSWKGKNTKTMTDTNVPLNPNLIIKHGKTGSQTYHTLTRCLDLSPSTTP